jgi:hypothetical protein
MDVHRLLLVLCPVLEESERWLISFDLQHSPTPSTIVQLANMHLAVIVISSWLAHRHVVLARVQPTVGTV